MGFFGGSPDKEKGPERIRGAVIRYNGENFLGGNNHVKALEAMIARYPEMELTPEKEEARGWLTTRGRIVSADEAREIIDRNGPIPGSEGIAPAHHDKLNE